MRIRSRISLIVLVSACDPEDPGSIPWPDDAVCCFLNKKFHSHCSSLLSQLNWIPDISWELPTQKIVYRFCLFQQGFQSISGAWFIFITFTVPTYACYIIYLLGGLVAFYQHVYVHYLSYVEMESHKVLLVTTYAIW